MLDSNMPFFLYGEMSVEYNGRARSTLERGRYVILYKADGTVLIHGADLATPRNYQGPKTILTIGSDNILTFTRHSETLIIKLYNIIEFTQLNQWSAAQIEITRTEKDLKRKIIDNSARYLGQEPKYVYEEYKVEYGVVDIVFSTSPIDDKHNTLYVIEVKRSKVTLNGVVQLEKYLKCFGHSTVYGFVAGPNISKKAQEYCNVIGAKYLAVNFDD